MELIERKIYEFIDINGESLKVEYRHDSNDIYISRLSDNDNCMFRFNDVESLNSFIQLLLNMKSKMKNEIHNRNIDVYS